MGKNTQQVVLDPDMVLAAKAKGLKVNTIKDVLRRIIKFAQREQRRIVAYSQHEKRVVAEYTGFDLSPYYADGRKIALRWFNRNHHGVHIGEHSLQNFLKFIEYEIPRHIGTRQTTQRIRHVSDQLARRGSYDALTPTAKGKWTKVLDHNRHDVIGLQALMLVCSRTV